MKVVKLKDIVVKWEYFPRVSLNEETVTRYMELYELGEPLPPIVVQKEKLIVIDGFHRIEAQRRLGFEEVDVVFLDIPEDEIPLTSIRLNRRHGRPFSQEDIHAQIRMLRFEFDPPLTYEMIGKEVGRSTSRVGEICRELELNINGTINAKVDRRSKITEEEKQEIQERVDEGESPSEVAEDYPVSESRVSQLKKEPRKTKPYKVSKGKTLAQMPRSWTRRNLEKRVKANNPDKDSQEIDFESYMELNDFESYPDLVEYLSKVYPDYEWYYPKERPWFNTYYNLPPEMLFEKSIPIQLKLKRKQEAKYAYVYGRVPKKVLDYVRDRLFDELVVEWPLIEVEQQDRRVFPELSDEELSDMYWKAQAHYREPEDVDDEEMRKWKDLLPE